MKTKLLVVSTVRDVSKTIRNDIKILRKALCPRFDTYWLFVESDSADNTISVLQQICLNDPTIRFISLGNLSSTLHHREARLAYCRNIYMHEIDYHHAYQHIPYVFVADCDGINHHLTASSIESCFNNGQKWDACFPNQKGPYHDIYALRHQTWNPICVNRQLEFLTAINVDIASSYRLALYSRMITIPLNNDWIEVASAFGGCAFYRLEAIRGKRYSCLENGRLVCEHVPFHHQLVQSGCSLYINPLFINSRINMHNRPSLFPWRVFLQCRRIVRSRRTSLQNRLISRFRSLIDSISAIFSM